MESMVLRKYTVTYMRHKNWIHTKWITELNARGKTIKLLKENIKVNLHDFGLSNDFLYTTLEAIATKLKK